MNRGGHGALGARGEVDNGLTAGDLTGQVIGLAIKVHKTVGPGLLEQIYEDCLCHEMALHGLTFQRQVELSLIYDGVRLPRAYRADIVVGETVILEIKSIEHILPVHEAQLLTYLRLSSCAVGLLLNFNTNLLKDGIRRFVNTASPRPPGPPRPP
jgi:GxxExxY protein